MLNLADKNDKTAIINMFKGLKWRMFKYLRKYENNESTNIDSQFKRADINPKKN